MKHMRYIKDSLTANSQGYNLMQLSYLLMEKLEASSEIINQTRPVTNQTSYPSVLHPPELDPKLMSVYRDVTIPVNIAIILASVLGLVGACRASSALLTPWMLAFSVGIISEATVFFYLISEGKVGGGSNTVWCIYVAWKLFCGKTIIRPVRFQYPQCYKLA